MLAQVRLKADHTMTHNTPSRMSYLYEQASLGNPAAAFQRGHMYFNAGHYQEAVKWFERNLLTGKPRKARHAATCFYLGWCYEHHLSVSAHEHIDPPEALYKQASEKGYPVEEARKVFAHQQAYQEVVNTCHAVLDPKKEQQSSSKARRMARRALSRLLTPEAQPAAWTYDEQADLYDFYFHDQATDASSSSSSASSSTDPCVGPDGVYRDYMPSGGPLFDRDPKPGEDTLCYRAMRWFLTGKR